MVLSSNTEYLLSALWVNNHFCLFSLTIKTISLFLFYICVCPLRVVTVTRKCIKWGQLLMIGSADSLELSPTITGLETTRVHVQKTAIHTISRLTVATCQRKMLFMISAQITELGINVQYILNKGTGKV